MTVKSFVDDIFSSVSNKYDIMNDLMSVGIHRIWKRQFIKCIDILPNSKLLDVASGTGDIAISVLKKYKSTKVTVCDKNESMLEIAKNKLIDKNLLNTDVICADAQSLPFQDNFFDYYTVAFGMRNFSDANAALKEALRVLKPGGKFCCLEFSNVENKCIARLYEIYSYNLIPFIGSKVTGNRSAYEYLVESIRQFPEAEEFSCMIEQTGFTAVKYKKMSFGVVAMHFGMKI